MREVCNLVNVLQHHAMDPEIRPLNLNDLSQFQAHFTRHRAESGSGDQAFMPFAPGDPDGPKGLAPDALARSLITPGWQRWFVVIETDGRIVGHVNLKGDGLTSGLHRCELGIGIQAEYRGTGLGRRLMDTAIAFARDVDTLAWVDLRVFAHNSTARALYRTLGFVEVGILVDRFRIDDGQVDDVIMTLTVS